MGVKLSDQAYYVLKWVSILAVPLCTFITAVVASILTGDAMAITTAVISGLGTLAGAIIKASDIEYQRQLKESEKNG